MQAFFLPLRFTCAPVPAPYLASACSKQRHIQSVRRMAAIAASLALQRLLHRQRHVHVHAGGPFGEDHLPGDRGRTVQHVRWRRTYGNYVPARACAYNVALGEGAAPTFTPAAPPGRAACMCRWSEAHGRPGAQLHQAAPSRCTVKHTLDGQTRLDRQLVHDQALRRRAQRRAQHNLGRRAGAGAGQGAGSEEGGVGVLAAGAQDVRSTGADAQPVPCPCPSRHRPCRSAAGRPRRPAAGSSRT